MVYLYFDDLNEHLDVYYSKQEMFDDVITNAPLGLEGSHYYFKLPDKIEIASITLDCMDNASIIDMIESKGYKAFSFPAEFFEEE